MSFCRRQACHVTTIYICIVYNVVIFQHGLRVCFACFPFNASYPIISHRTTHSHTVSLQIRLNHMSYRPISRDDRIPCGVLQSRCHFIILPVTMHHIVHHIPCRISQYGATPYFCRRYSPGILDTKPPCPGICERKEAMSLSIICIVRWRRYQNDADCPSPERLTWHFRPCDEKFPSCRSTLPLLVEKKVLHAAGQGNLMVGVEWS